MDAKDDKAAAAAAGKTPGNFPPFPPSAHALLFNLFKLH